MENSKTDLINRSKYYASTVTVHSLKSGDDYQSLGEVCVIFICKDPFDKELPIYTARREIVEADIEHKFQSVIQFINVQAYKKVENKDLEERIRKSG